MQKLFYLFLNFLLITFFGTTAATSPKNPFNHPSKKAFSFRSAIFFGSLISGLFRSKPILRQILLLFIFCGGLTSAFAATLTVTNGNDSGSGSLRNQIAAATSGDVIVFSGVTTITLTGGFLNVNKNLTINGGSGVTITRNNAADRLITIDNNATVSINNVTFSNGDNDYGGALYVGPGSVTLTSCIFQNNHADQQGGAIYAGGAITMTNCTVKNNSCPNGPSAAHLAGPTAIFTGCTFNGNTNTGTYAILVQSPSQNFSMTNCTVTGNTTFAMGYYNQSGSGSITNCTFSDNEYAIWNYLGNLVLKNCLFSGHTNDLMGIGASASSSYNIFSTSNANGLTDGVNNNQLNVSNIQLQALASNGGPTQTQALAPCSPAVNSGTSTGAPTTDQRGSSRVSTVDIGAFEYQSTPPVISVSSSVTNACNGNNGSIDLTVSGGTSPYTYDWSGSGSGSDPRTNLAAGTYNVTVTDNAGCTRTHSATVTNLTPTTANAGSDQTGVTTCGLTQVTLAANSPSVGTGAWSVVNGTGGSFGNASSRTSTFSGTAGSTYTLRWTISNGSCTSTDDVVITFNRSPTTANAGSDQTGAATCGLTQVTLAANTATVGTGAWSVVNGTGGSFGNASSPTSTFTGTAGSTYTLRWTISNSPCTASTDDVVITFNRSPTTANAGSDQTGAATCGLTQVTLAANTATVGTGAWSVVNGTGGSFGNASSPNSTFTGTAGSTYTLRWTISNSPCTASTDDVVITFNQSPTTANAGPDQTGVATCGLTQVTLAANTATVGTGAWSVVNGTGGSFGNASSPTSTFTGTAGSTYTLRWTISNSPCTASADDVVITFNRSPTTANAGSDQTGAATCGLTQVTLAANSPSVGTGAWSVVNGTGGSFGNASSPTSTFTGTAGSTYTLRWTISNSPCTASIDDVVITFNRNPTTANAGSDQTGAATCGLTQVTLAGNTATVGTGAWSVVNGTGGSFGNASSPTSTFTGTAGSTYTLRWTISNSSCTASTDDVVITFNRSPTTANAGSDQTGAATCGLTQVTLAANTATVGTGAWSVVNGTGGSFGNASSPTSTFTGTAGSTYTLRWTISNSPCTASTDDVVITFSTAPATPTASVTAQPTCTTPTGTIVVTAPTGTDIQYSINGTDYQTLATFSGLTPNMYSVTVKNTATGCISTPLSLTVNAVPDAPATPTASVTLQPTCTTPTGTIVVTAPTGAGIEYSVGGAYQASGTFSGLTPNMYSVTAKNTATGCVSTSLSLTINAVPDAPATPTASVTLQPTCTTPTGTIVVTAPTGAGIEYSVGSMYQASGTFSGLTPNMYSVTAKNMVTGCVSTPLSLTINAVPDAPATPTASVTLQPTCTTPTGTIVVTAPTGAGIEYSVGSMYQASGTFSGLTPNMYSVTAKNMVTGCISTSLSLTINAVPDAPATPTASVTLQPTCTTPTGTIVVTAPTGTDIQYSINGTDYQTLATFSGLNPTTYSVTAKNMVTGCVSTPLSLTINAVPDAPATPTASVTAQPTCTTPTGMIVVTAPTGTDIQYSINGTDYQTLATFSGLNPTTYSVTAKNMVTGCVSTPLSLTINAVPDAPATPTASVTSQPTCTTPTGTIVVTAPTGAGIEYSVGSMYQASGTFSGLTPNMYSVTAKNMVTGCVSTPLSLTINAVPDAPATPTASVTSQPTCTTPTGTIVVTAPTGAGIEYSVGGAYQTSGTFSGLTPNMYSVTAKNTATGCVSTSLSLTINAVPDAPATPTASVTLQPTCTTPTGTIVVTAPTGTGIEYSVGGTYQASGTFSGLVPNMYLVTAKNTATGCISTPLSLTINAVPDAPATPTASVTVQPTCTTPTGTIVVTAPTGAGIEYSVGGTYQASGTFSGLVPNMYLVTAKNTATGCISTPLSLTINAVPDAPATPTASVTVQPTCTTPTGTIVVTAPTGAGIEYSVGGTYQASGTFSGLVPNMYLVTAKNTATGCISTPLSLTINAVPDAPATPTASVTAQPTCTTPTGTIVVTAPTGTGIEYSVGGTYQASGTFSGLVPNMYLVTAKNTATGCISTPLSLTINAVPDAPATPTASVTVQPTCTTPTGTIVVTAPTGAGIEYSVGGTYQASGTFSGLVPNMYLVTAKNTATGCISTPLSLTINAVPDAPATPTASVTLQPTCTTPTGTIVVTAPTGTGIEYSVGGTYQASGTFSGLVPNMYLVTAKNTATGCISTPLSLTINAVPDAPATPTASVTVQPTCTTPTGTIVVTAPTGAGIEYSVGGTYQASGTFSGLVPNMYLVTAKNTATGCISTPLSLTINAVPDAPATPTASVTLQPTCTTPTGTIVVTAPTGTGIEYSVGGTYQASGTFSGLVPNMYLVTAKNTATGCISTPLSLTINAVPDAPATPTASVTLQPTCTTPTGTIVVTAPTGAGIEYSVGGTYQASGTFSGLVPNMYLVTAKNTATGCISTPLSLTINAVPDAPATPTASVTLQPTCTTPTGTIVVTAPTGAGIEYSVGGAYQPSGTFSGLTPNMYSVTAKNMVTGCVSTPLSLTVNAVPDAPATPTASVTLQPTCTTPTGTIVVTAPTGAGIEYSVGSMYQASGTFSGLTPNMYSVTAKNTATGCISTPLSLTINAVPDAPATPTASVTAQPTCTTPTGTIVVTAPTGTGIEYSVGGTYQASGTFSGLVPNMYLVTAKNTATGCISTPLSLTINAVPDAPATPTASVTVQPTCTTPTGTIVVTAPTGAGIEYSVGSMYQASGTFSGLTPNMYFVTAKNTATGCISTSLSLVVNTVPGAPTLTDVTLTQPTCALPTGTAVVNAMGSGTLEYSKDGMDWQSSNTFSMLSPANYTFSVRLQSNPTCVATSTPQIINAVPVPTATISYVGSPYTNTGTATVTLTGTAGGAFSATPSGLSLNASTGEINLAASSSGSYTVTYTIAASGSCAEVTDTALVAIIVPNLAQIIYVNGSNTASGQDGSSWSKAFANLQAGLSAASVLSGGDIQVWVAAGTYKPGTLRKDVFEIPSGVQVYGGFVGTETELSQRNWNTQKTVLSGEIGTSSLTDNVNHVVVLSATNDTTRLDGFVIEKGYADFYVAAQGANLDQPSLLSSGGGILVINRSKGLITNCLITNNRAIGGGGILLRDSSEVSITNSIIAGNEATFGGGIYMESAGRPHLENLLIVSNKGLGGGLYLNYSAPILTHCTIASNQSANGTQGGIFNSNSSGTLQNSILWGNSGVQTTPGISIRYSIVEGGFAGIGNLNQNPLFIKATPSGLAPTVNLGDYHLQPCSPAINAGDNAASTLPLDLDGNVRPYTTGLAIVDMGCYESQSTGGAGPAMLSVSEPITGGTVLKTGGRITATNQVSGATVEYRGSQSVTLLPGFSAAGTTFQAVIGDCPN
jgi:predicted outer membrane repeat protein